MTQINLALLTILANGGHSNSVRYWCDILLSQQNVMHQCIVCATQFNSCCAKLPTLFLLSYRPNRPELNSIANYKI